MPATLKHSPSMPTFAVILKQASRDILGIEHIRYRAMRSNESNSFFKDRDQNDMYEGLPNTDVLPVIMKHVCALLTLIRGERSFKLREK